MPNGAVESTGMIFPYPSQETVRITHVPGPVPREYSVSTAKLSRTGDASAMITPSSIDT
ncbi:hypothetical protein BCO37747_05792 [Burkholderia contaminans]|uniref:Uncharacterized protein n=3 Tax=Burkholderia cepacia complex TaxID=87882 RepID=A0A286T7M1_9BURK|nr:hypothetical protein BCCH1_81100 [Burkholderia contaminans]CAB3973633.1 hypothetical protein BLA3211_07604 [Burkholderia aenigmatica]VBB17395.1 hypothetical protein BSTAB16_7610 [Burkholderia stabilis]VWD46637.1 hypothetical protein BCO37747_05792 [Burkholderia contaminans]